MTYNIYFVFCFRISTRRIYWYKNKVLQIKGYILEDYAQNSLITEIGIMENKGWFTAKDTLHLYVVTCCVQGVKIWHFFSNISEISPSKSELADLYALKKICPILKFSKFLGTRNISASVEQLLLPYCSYPSLPRLQSDSIRIGVHGAVSPAGCSSSFTVKASPGASIDLEEEVDTPWEGHLETKEACDPTIAFDVSSSCGLRERSLACVWWNTVLL